MEDYEIYDRYVAVQNSGKFNMITDAVDAAKAAGLSLEDYRAVVANYNKYKAASEAHHIIEDALASDCPF